MNNGQIYPFQRNRYYSGKLLTSADFQAEQDYFNNKNRFMNQLMYGSGIVCGLGVVSLDDLSVLVENGVAIDGLGREIILDSSAVKKLSAIDGFDKTESEEISLCIKYNEEAVNSVYAVNRGQSDKEFEYSRISENSMLFIIDKELADARYDIETEFLTTGILYSDSDYMVSVSMPCTVSKGKAVKMVVEVQKLSDAENRLTVHGTLQVPGFVTAYDTQEIPLEIESVSLQKDEKYTVDYWMTTQKSEEESTSIILKTGTAQAFVNDIATSIDGNFKLKINLSDISPRELVNREIGRLSLEMRNIGGYEEYIRLADITLIRTAGAYVIEKIEEGSVKKYIGTPAQSVLRGNYLDYFYKGGDVKKPATVAYDSGLTKDAGKTSNKNPEITSGIVEIPLGENARKGDIRYSGEIVHGLGKGNVFVQVGFESIALDPALGANAKSTIYGNADLFRNNKSEAPMVDKAVKILNDKGSFVVAAKLLENVDYLVLTLRWVAMKFPAGDEFGIDMDYTGKAIVPETPTVVLDARQSHFFGVRFENMESCSLMYELTEEGSGEITTDGVYTAPNKEGVFEIRIFCTDMPVVCAYAYAIVKKKVAPEIEEPIKEKEAVLDEISI